MKPCFGWAGRLFGHRFRGRWSEKRSANPALWTTLRVKVTGSAVDDLFNRLTDEQRTYHGDICERCGEWREVPKP